MGLIGSGPPPICIRRRSALATDPAAHACVPHRSVPVFTRCAFTMRRTTTNRQRRPRKLCHRCCYSETEFLLCGDS